MTSNQNEVLPIVKGANATELIQRLGQDDLIQHGRLLVFGIDAIRNHNPRRWPIRQQRVWDYITREFHKRFSDSDHLIRLNDVDFLLIQPTESAVAAQSKALTLLRVVLKFFLGQAASTDIILNVVTAMGGEELKCEPVVKGEPAFARLDETDSNEPVFSPLAQEEKDVDCLISSKDSTSTDSKLCEQRLTTDDSSRLGRPAPRMLNGDRQYEVLFDAEPIWSIKQKAIVSYTLRPLIFERRPECYFPVDMTAVSTADLIRLDLIILTEAKRLLQTDSKPVGFVLSVPINQSTLSSNKGRQAVQSILDDMKPYAASRLIVCVIGLASGAPNSKIAALVSAIRSRCRGIVARAPSLGADISHWRGSHLSGVSIDLHRLETEVVPTMAQLSQFAKRAESVAPALIIYAASNSAITLAAWSCGFTHVGGEIFLRNLDRPFTAVRFEPKSLYRNQLQHIA